MNKPVLYVLLLLLFFTTNSFGQNGNTNKPEQFHNSPSVIDCSESSLNSIFNTAAGQTINLSFPGNFSFSGNVTSNLVKYNNLQTAVIQSAALDNTIFSVSKIKNKDNSITYLGRIINTRYFDGYELQRNTAGNYQLIKIETGRLMQDCKQL
ncbi:hypothetical protein [Ferruginibacter sp. SUN106]|uniref:hypothetical protein n=1 Tax=Ferruginibacter sp. SUN106 TaxID=2978348 RepID=UPI003D36AEEF